MKKNQPEHSGTRSVNRIHLLAQFLSCALIVVALVFILSRIFSIVLFSPDDIAYERIMSGLMTGSPEGHTFYIRYTLSAFIALLYRINNSFSWYQAFLMGSVCLSLFLILERIVTVTRKHKLIYLLISTLLCTMLFSSAIVHLEWTETAGLLASTAIFRYCTIPNKASRKRNIWEYGVCIFLIVLCLSLRNSVCYMITPLVGVCWIYRLLQIKQDELGEDVNILSYYIGKIKCARTTRKPKQYKEKLGDRLTRMIKGKKTPHQKKILVNILFFVLLLLFCYAVKYIHIYNYSGEAWTRYRLYNRDRATLIDYYGYPDYDQYADQYAAAGISKETYTLMKSDYNFVVPCNRFQEIDIKPLAELSKSINQSDYKAKLKEVGKQFESIATSKKYVVCNITMLVLLVMNLAAYREKKLYDLLFIFAIVLWGLGISFYLSYQGRFPERVIKCVDYTIILGLLATYMSSRKGTLAIHLSGLRAHRRILVSVISACLICGILVNWTDLKTTNQGKKRGAIANIQILQYCSQHPENAYFRDSVSFGQRSELFMSEGYNVSNYLGIGGWTYYSPLYDALLARWNCENFAQAAIENRNLFYLVNENRMLTVKNHMDAYFASKGIKMRLFLVDSFETNAGVVKVLKFMYTGDE